jgi:signal transduction histidine kinase
MPRTRTVAGKRPRRAKRVAPRRSRAPRARAIEAALADIAHEIRTPLTGILALSELLATSELGERERGWATAIKSTADHLALFTSLIVDAARADARGLVLRRELIRPHRLADALPPRSRAVPRPEASRPKSISPASAGGRDRRSAAAASGAENLIDNAVKFTERGSVRLDVAREGRARQGTAGIHAVRHRHRAHPAEIKRLFRPFAQANAGSRAATAARARPRLVRRIAKAMGGDLAVARADLGAAAGSGSA